MLSESFSTKLNEVSKDLGMNPRDLLLVMFLESGVDPTARNPGSKTDPGGAIGLIQFMPDTLKGMGLSKNEVATFGHKTAEQQLDYVKQYIQNHRALIGGQPFTSATQYYVANFFPIALHRWNGTDPVRNAGKVVVSSHSKDPRERQAYAANPMLDADKDGVIRVRDITNVLMGMERSPKFQEMLQQFNAVAGDGIVTERGMRRTQPRKYPFVENNLFIANFLNGLGELLDKVATIDFNINTINKYGCDYPQNKYLIYIDSDSDFSSKLEFARILSLALKEETDSPSEIYTDGSDVELECAVNADKDKGLEVVKEFCVAISDVFEDSTKSVGGIKIYTFVSSDIDPRYQRLDIKLAEMNYRKFHLKFIK